MYMSMKNYSIIYKEKFWGKKYFNFCIVILLDYKEVINSFKFHIRKMFKVSNGYPCWSVEIHTVIAIKINDTIISCGVYVVDTYP